ncbi:hypothetical protein HDU89_007951 [Geranomyces variabilis]|nr:hypothetical protein HDU89_007951 [Geranomyces variabilis]
MASAARNLEPVILDDDMSACVRRALALGFFLNVARIQLNEDDPTKWKLNPKDVWHITFRQRVAIQVKEPQKLVRSKWILFDHLTLSGSSKRRGLTSPVEQSWLEEAAPALDFQTHPAAHAGGL